MQSVISFEQMNAMLILLEFALCVAFMIVSYFTKNIYFRGVSIGLLIAWVTGAIAYLKVKGLI